MKKRMWMLAAAVMVALSGIMPAYAAKPSEDLKVMSFNIRYNSARDTGDTNWEARKASVIKMLETELPDVVGLQEPRAAQRVYLKQNLKNYTYEEVPGTGDGKGGNTGLIWRNDRFEKLDGGYFFLSRTPDVPSRSFDVPDEVWRASVWVHLRDKKSGKDFYFMSTHMPVRTKVSMPNEEYINSRVLSAKLNVERMKKLAGNKGTCFIVGDMNCAEQYEDGTVNPDGVRALKPYYKWMKSARALDKHPEINSFTAFGKGVQGPNRKIDFIFYRNAEPLSFETLTGSYGVKYVSDHWPIVFNCKF